MAKPIAIVTGVPELDARLRALASDGIARASRSALGYGIRYLASAMQAAAPTMGMKLAIGSRFLRRGEGLGAKAGAAVGKRAPGALVHKGRGVGIGARNIHWFVLGTQQRKTGVRTYRVKGGRRSRPTGKSSHSTGRMPPHPFIAQAAASAAPAAQSLIHERLDAAIDREWRKVGQ